MRIKLLSLAGTFVLSTSGLSLAGEGRGRYGPAEISDEYIEFMGWTADDSAYVYSKKSAVRLSSDDDRPTEYGEVAVVRSGQTGAVLKEFLLNSDSLSRDDCADSKCSPKNGFAQDPATPEELAQRRRLWALPNKTAFAKWRIQNRLSCKTPTNGYGFVDMNASAEPKRVHIHVHGGRNFQGFFIGPPGDRDQSAASQPITLRLSGPASAEGVPSAVVRNLQFEGTPDGRVTACMGPASRRIGWLVERFDGSVSDMGEQFFHIGPAGGPRIQLLPGPTPAAAAAARVDDELKKAGYTLLVVGPGRKQAAGAATVVQARTMLEPDAQRIAALFPGSTVGKLDPSSAYDIVIRWGSAPLMPAPVNPAVTKTAPAQPAASTTAPAAPMLP